MKNIHETQPPEDNRLQDDEIYTPVEDLQKIEAGGTYKRKNLKMDTLPLGIRLIGYCIIFFIIVTTVLGLFMSFFD
jgi:hypothetical protein